MTGDDEPPIGNEPYPDGLPNCGPGWNRNTAPDGDINFIRLLKRAIRKIKRDTGEFPNLEEVAGLMKSSVPVLQQSIEKCIESTNSSELSKIFSQLRVEIIPGYNFRGFLNTDAKLKIGEEVLAQYVCVHNNRIILSDGMAKLDRPGPGPSPSSDHRERQYDIQQTNAFHSGKNNEKFRRASDLFLPPLQKNQNPNRMRIGHPDDLLWLVTDLEGGMRTGCVKASCQSKHSRSALLLYKGRVVGCVYANNQLKDPIETEKSLPLMLKDCATPDTQLIMYALPEEEVLAMSAFFLGYPVERSDDLDARSYMDYIMSSFAEKEQTACLAFSFNGADTVLSLVHKGKFVGAFQVENQEFSRDIEYVHKQLREKPNALAEASILPTDLFSPTTRFGYILSLNMP